MKKLYFLSFFVFLTIATSAVIAEVFTVDTDDDVIDATDGKLSLREALALASGNGETNTITFKKVKKITLEDEELVVDNTTVRINGPITLDGDKQNRILRLTNGAQAVLDLVFLEDGFSDENGGAILVEAGCVISLTNCDIENNSALGDGGALQVEGQLEKCIDCFVDGNSAANSGGAFNLIGDNQTTEIVECLFQKNVAGNNGGALNLAQNKEEQSRAGDIALIFGCEFKSNLAQNGNGGAISSDSASTITTIDKCLFDSNSSGNSGGAFFNDGELSAMFNSSFVKNKSDLNGGAYFDGGNSQNGTQIAACSFEQNTALGGSGGAMFLENGVDILVEEGLFERNEAAINGGAITNDGILEILDTFFTRNDADNNGGGIINNDDGDLTVQRSTFEKNQAFLQGGAIFSNDNSVLLAINSTFSNNSAKENGGGILDENSVGSEISFCTFTKNIAGEDGGGIALEANSDVNINNTIVENNKAKDGDDLLGTFVDGGFNLVKNKNDHNLVDGDNGNIVGKGANLNSLKDNGGAVETHAIRGGSRARDAADPDTVDVVIEDGRNFLRPDAGGGLNDIGAFEFDADEKQALLENTPFAISAKKEQDEIGIVWQMPENRSDIIGFRVWRRKSKERKYTNITPLLLTVADTRTGKFFFADNHQAKHANYMLELVQSDGQSRFVKRVTMTR